MRQRFQSRFESRRRNPLSETQAFDDMFRLVLARDIGIRTISDRTRFRLPRDILRLCVYADLPDELVCRDGRHPDRMMGRNIGRVLYSIDLPYTPPELPEKEPQTDSSSSDNPQERRPVDRGTQ